MTKKIGVVFFTLVLLLFLKSGIAPLILVIVIGIVLAAGGLGLGLAWKVGFFGKPGGGPTDGTTPNGTPTPPPQPPPSDGEEIPPPEIPADWKTYTSEDFGFSVKYPPDWQWRVMDPEAARGVVFQETTPNDPLLPYSISITIEPNLDKLSPIEWVDSYIELFPDIAEYLRENINRKSITVGGREAEEVIGLPAAYGTIDVYVGNGSEIYVLMLNPYDHADPFQDQDLYAEVFRTMVGSLRFVP